MRRFGYRGTGTLALNIPNPVEVQLVVEAPGLDREERLYLASNLNGWNPRNDRYRFRRLGASRFEIAQFMTPGTVFEFKVTRGGWDRVEVGPDGRACPNHLFTIEHAAAFEIRIADWQDKHPQAPKQHTTVGDVRSLGEFTIHGLNRPREVLIYLPPGYEQDPQRRYPVLYMFDGQNLFDEATAFSGEWGVDETLERLIPTGELPPMIVVGIYNGQENRINEQSPWPCSSFDTTGEGATFTEWVARDLKARIDRGFRTLGDPAHTGIGGSSMGGLTALYALFRFPEVFGRVLVMSPSFWFARQRMLSFVREHRQPPGAKIYLDYGLHEGSYRADNNYLVRLVREVAQQLRRMGFRDDEDLKWVEDPHGRHCEADWARRMPGALKFLFGS